MVWAGFGCWMFAHGSRGYYAYCPLDIAGAMVGPPWNSSFVPRVAMNKRKESIKKALADNWKFIDKVLVTVLNVVTVVFAFIILLLSLHHK
jgi:hypothetical protein